MTMVGIQAMHDDLKIYAWHVGGGSSKDIHIHIE